MPLLDDPALDRLMQHLGLFNQNQPLTPQIRKRYIPVYVQRKVLERDGSKCRYCGSTENLEFDHIVLHSRGGSNCGNNLQSLCRACNRRRYTQRRSWWAAFMRERDFNPEDLALELFMRQLGL